jgi:ribosomal protein S18 acetylase RimI-like enzyme
MDEGTRRLTGLRRVGSNDTDALCLLFASLPERDRSFLEGPLTREDIARWPQDKRSSRWLIADGDRAGAYLGIIPHEGWSAHVGDLRLVVASDHRHHGLGRALAPHGLLEGVRLGLLKIQVAVAADKEGDIAMFTSIGFRPEALLEDHIRDRAGDLHDLVLLAHDVSQVRDDLAVVGADDAVGLGDS